MDLETKIKLNMIDTHAETIAAAIGLEETEYLLFYGKLEKQIDSGNEKLPFSEKVIQEVSKQSLGDENEPVSQIVIKLWRNAGREEISIKEFLLAVIDLKRLDELHLKIDQFLRRKISSLQSIHIPNFDLDSIKEIVVQHGDQVSISGKLCINWLKEHKSYKKLSPEIDNEKPYLILTCKGCLSEIGCKKLNLIIRAFHACERYEPKSLQDSLEKEKWLNAKVEEILGKKTLEELENIFVPL
jgi:hypothetical protein